MIDIVYDKDGFLENICEKSWPVVLFGAGYYGIKIAQYLKENGMAVKSFCDTNPQKIGNVIDGIPVKCLDDLKDGRDYHIIITPYNKNVKEEISELVKSSGICGKLYFDVNFESGAHYNPDKKQFMIHGYDFSKTMPWFYPSAYNKRVTPSYIKQLYPDLKYHFHGSYFTLMDYNSKYVNIERGIRTTSDLPEKYTNTVYFFGNSRIFGSGVEDSETIPSFFQRILNEQCPGSYRVINLSMPFAQNNNSLNMLLETDIKENDIVIMPDFELFVKDGVGVTQSGERIAFEIIKKADNFCREKGAQFYFVWLSFIDHIINKSLEEKYISEVTYLTPNPEFRCQAIDHDRLIDFCINSGIKAKDFTRYINEPHDSVLFIDLWHYGPNGCKLIAEKIYDFVIKGSQFEKLTDKQSNELLDIITDSNFDYVMPVRNNPELIKYLDFLKKLKCNEYNNIGVAVINANPFTKGHLYLLEQASSQVDFLYVLVVEENMSEFKFADRLQMVELGTKGLANLKVLPSGSFVISSSTFPEYFNRTSKNADCSNDLIIFGTFIAKALGASKRFVGEEPFSKITDSYNRQMKEILPQFGIEVIEIPRCSVNGKTVSATEVRELIKENRVQKIRELVPESTYDYIVSNNLSV